MALFHRNRSSASLASSSPSPPFFFLPHPNRAILTSPGLLSLLHGDLLVSRRGSCPARAGTPSGARNAGDVAEGDCKAEHTGTTVTAAATTRAETEHRGMR
mmetsp:Transcript_35128/g.82070  ORF Transcript_35128/g.82070 Transcript_35128/m.82070 type:complete len:101 (-) Transcript_35128:67-369(-)